MALKRLVLDPLAYAGRTAVIVGNGTSMLASEWPERLARAQAAGAILLVTNGGYKSFPFADVLMCSDRHWVAANPNLEGFTGPEIVVTYPRAAQAVKVPDKRMRVINRAFIEKIRGDLFRDPHTLVEGHTSLSTMVSLAVQRGASRIVLAGLDLAPGPDMRRRTYDDAKDTAAASEARYAKQARHLTTQAHALAGRPVTVLNASPRSRLDCYTYVEWSNLQW